MTEGLETNLERLFEAARGGPSLQFIFALVRLEGITSERDPLRLLRGEISREPAPDQSRYCELLKASEALLGLLGNLSRLARREPFDPAPFGDLLPWAVHRRPEDLAREIANIAEFTAAALDELRMPVLASTIREAFPSEIDEACLGSPGIELPSGTLGAWQRLVAAVHDRLFSELAAFKTQPILYRLPHFEVLELIQDDDGLCGFRLHFSNGTSAQFERKPDSTECLNVIPRSPVEFIVGDASSLREEWSVRGTPLHELGLPGRYNDPGAWKPLIFPGDPDPIRTRVKEMSDDPDVQGSLFYIHCTGHWMLEFVALMNAELPSEVMVAGDRVHLYKCNPSTEEELRPTVFIYDGWVDLPDASPETVAAALQDVARLMNRTALALDVPVSWRPKYSFRGRHSSTWLGENVEELNRIFAAFPTGPDEEAIDIAVDWYNRGASSGSPFTAFLCYYIGIESLANAIGDTDATLGLVVTMDEPTTTQRLSEMNRLHDELYEDDPEQFVVRAYFDVIKTVTERTRTLVRTVFGTGSREYELLFTKSEGVALTDLRSKLAHGRWSEISASEARQIRDRVWQVKTICRDLILRILLNLAPGGSLPGSSRGATMSFDDPRSIEVASSEAGFPSHDWSIKPEWVAWD